MKNNILNFLQNEINENKISHAFLVETNDCEKLIEEITNILIKNEIILAKSFDKNISVFLIKPENNLIDKNKILELQKFIVTKSVINKHKVYFIENAELMNLSSFNKLLKVLEEPSENVIGFLITENENMIISTIKSRCKKFKEYYEMPLIDEKNELIEQLLKIKSLSYIQILELKKQILQNEKSEILNIISEFKNNLLNGYQNLNEIRALAKYYKILDNIMELIKSNVNAELCLDKMFIEMRK